MPQALEVVPFEDGELLQEDRPLAPGAALVDLVAAVIEGDRLFDFAVKSSQILDGQQPTVGLGMRGNEASDFPAVEGVACRGQAMGATLTLGFLLGVDQAAKRATEVGIFQYLTDVGHPAARQVDLS